MPLVMLPRTDAVFSPVDFSTDSVRWKLQEKRKRLLKEQINRGNITDRQTWQSDKREYNGHTYRSRRTQQVPVTYSGASCTALDKLPTLCSTD